MTAATKPRVCHIASGDLWAGAEVQIYNLLTAACYRDEVDACCILLNSGQLERRLRAAGVEVEVISESGYGFFRLVARIAARVQERGCDVLHTHRYKENLVGVLVARRCGGLPQVKTVYGLREVVSGLRRLKRGLVYFVDSLLSRWCIDGTIAVTEDIRRELGPVVPAQRITVISNSVHTGDIEAALDALPASPAEHSGPPVVGTFCRLVPIKGLDGLIRAAAVLPDRHADAQFVIGGDGPERERLQDLCATRQLQARFTFTGFMDEIFPCVASFDVFVVSSLHEGFPTAALEAMALGVPVVATAVGGIPEIIDDGHTGILVAPGNDRALAAGIARLLGDAGLARDISTRARALVFDKYSNETQARATVELYRRLPT